MRCSVLLNIHVHSELYIHVLCSLFCVGRPPENQLTVFQEFFPNKVISRCGHNRRWIRSVVRCSWCSTCAFVM